jgi:phosphoglycerol transferase
VFLHIIQVALVVLLIILARQTSAWPSRIYLTLCASLILFLGITDEVFNELTGTSFNHAIWFHLRYGLEGAGLADFKTVIMKFTSILTFGLAGIWFFGLRSTDKKLPLPTRDNLLIGVGSMLLVLTFTFHPFSQAVAKVLYPTKITEPFVEFYITPEINPASGLDRVSPPNLVWIYAESLERTYLDETLFPGLTPGLKTLETTSATFTNIEQVGATGWTIAGMVASQCGIPLTTTGGHGNSMNGISTFLPGAKCLGDLLKAQNYHLTYMGGADLSFAGKGKFFKTHSFDEVLGRNQLESRLPDKAYVNGWGLYDDSLFDLAVEKYQELLNSQKDPFALLALTVDTHHPEGHLSRRCDGLKYLDGKNPMLNAVHCADRLISSLVEDIRRLDKQNNTVIVVSSDHLAMQNTASSALNSRPRRNLFIVNWPDHINPVKVERPAGTFSLGPTILGFMGFSSEGLGLGRDLMKTQPTFIEAHQDYHDVLSSWTPEFQKAWQLPQRVTELKVIPKARQVIVGVSTFSLPVLMSLDGNNDVTSLIFPEGEDTVSLVKRAEAVDGNKKKILIEYCKPLKTKFEDLEAPTNSICWWDISESKPVVVTKPKIFSI